MAQISITVPNNLLSRVVDGIVYLHGYQDLVSGQPNPESKNDAAKRLMITWAKECVKAYEAGIAQKNARDAAIATADAEITIT